MKSRPLQVQDARISRFSRSINDHMSGHRIGHKNLRKPTVNNEQQRTHHVDDLRKHAYERIHVYCPRRLRREFKSHRHRHATSRATAADILGERDQLSAVVDMLCCDLIVGRVTKTETWGWDPDVSERLLCAEARVC